MATASWPECYSDAVAPRRLFMRLFSDMPAKLFTGAINWCGDPDLNRQKQLAMDLA